MVTGDYKRHDIVAVQAGLVYAGESVEVPVPTAVPAAHVLHHDPALLRIPRQSQSILGGTKKVKIGSDGRVVFDNLCMCEASTKHKEREFRLEFSLVRRYAISHLFSRTWSLPFSAHHPIARSDGRVLSVRRYSRPFYAYSHKRVLSRRRTIPSLPVSFSFPSLSLSSIQVAAPNPIANPDMFTQAQVI